MRCRGVQKLLPQWEEGGLSPSQQLAVKSHLAGCSTCRQAAAHLSILKEWTAASLPEPGTVPVALRSRVEERVRHRAKVERKGVGLIRWRWKAAPVIVSVLLVLGLAALFAGKAPAHPKEDFEKALLAYDGAFELSGEERERRLQQSLELLEDFRARYPENQEFGSLALLFLADCYQQAEKPEEAAKTYQAAVDRFPDDREAGLEARVSLTNLRLNCFHDPEGAAKLASWLVENEKEWSGLAGLCVSVAEALEPSDRWAAYRWFARAEESGQPGQPAVMMASRKRISLEGQLRDSSFVTDWWIVAPFSNEGRFKFSYAFPPEMEIDLKTTYQGKAAQIGWKRVTDPEHREAAGHINLNELFDPDDYVAAYCLTYMHSPDDRKVHFLIGSDDSVRFWLNDEIVLSNPTVRGAWQDQDITEALFVHKGWNKILLRVSDNAAGAWGFYFRVADQDLRLLPDIYFDPLRGGEL